MFKNIFLTLTKIIIGCIILTYLLRNGWPLRGLLGLLSLTPNDLENDAIRLTGKL